MSQVATVIAERIKEQFPLARVEVDAAAREGGTDHIDVRLGDRLVVIECGDPRGYGVSLITEAALDSGPDFRLADADKAIACTSILLSEGHDARFKDELGSGDATTASIELRREEVRVSKGERKPPRREAA